MFANDLIPSVQGNHSVCDISGIDNNCGNFNL